MSDIVIKKAKATNFLQYKEIDMDLQSSGLVFLSGELSHDRSRSNSAGKTAAISVVPWVLWGKTLRDMRDSSSVINYDATECSAEVEGTMDGQSFFVKRARSRSGSVVVVASFAGSSRSRDVQEEINAVFGTFDMAQNTVFLAQRKALEFLSSTDAERRKILEDLLKMRTWREAHDRVRDDIEWANESIQKLTSEMNSAQQKIDKIVSDREHALEVARTNLSARVEEAESLLSEKSSVAEETRSSIEALESEFSAALSVYNEAKTRANAESRRLNNLRSRLADATSARRKAESSLRDARKGVCGSCSQSIPVNTQLVTRLENACIDAEKDEKTCSADLEDSMSSSSHLNDEASEKMASYNAVANKKNALVYSLDAVQKEMESIEKKIRSLEQEKKKVDDTLADGKEEEVLRLSTVVKNRTSALADLKKGMDAMRFWKEGFSLKGVPSMLVGESLPLLVQKTNEVLSVLSDNELTLDILTLDAKRDGKSIMEKLTFVVGKEGREVYMEDCSAGEQRRIVISIFLALSKMQTVLTGQSWNIRMVDELFDELDPHGIERVMRVLKNMAGTYTILVTSHRTELKDLDGFTRRWTARRTVGTSVLVCDEAV